jgi:hypothetical protein
MKRRVVARLSGSGAVAALALGGGWMLAAAPSPAQAAPSTKTFEFIGKPETFVVPANVCQVTIDAFGAQGGKGVDSGDPSATGGLGGRATATLAVTPGETLQVNVGGRGGDAQAPATAAAGSEPEGPGKSVRSGAISGAPGTGGFNGGADGGTGIGPGGGGGGASDVRQSGTALPNRVVVAGGAGGGGGGGEVETPPESQGGAGGGGTGVDGKAGGTGPDDSDSNPTPGGKGGTQGAGGDGGSNESASGVGGSTGSGGIGGAPNRGGNDAGGGGGGGLFGGGGGAGELKPVALQVATDDGGGGGGGSGFGPTGVTFETGVREGDGVLTITFDPDAGGCPAPAPVAAVVAQPRFTG